VVALASMVAKDLEELVLRVVEKHDEGPFESDVE
jgi:hypothetical protein